MTAVRRVFVVCCGLLGAAGFGHGWGIVIERINGYTAIADSYYTNKALLPETGFWLVAVGWIFVGVAFLIDHLLTKRVKWPRERTGFAVTTAVVLAYAIGWSLGGLAALLGFRLPVI